MKNKIFKYGIPTGLIISFIGFILLKVNLIEFEVYSQFSNIYRLTTFFSVIFVCINSTFIKNQLKQLLKIIGTSFAVILIINILKEFNIYDIQAIEIVGSITITGLLILYLSHFYKKSNRNSLDIIKLGLVFFAVIGVFLKFLEIAPANYKYLTAGLFWITISGMILYNYSHEIREKIKN